MNSVSRLFQEVPDFGEIAFYAIIVAVMIFGVVFGRFLIRGLVNRRVKGIRAEGLDIGEVSAMGQKGLLTEEELKKIRRRFAERQLQETQEEKAGIRARDLLLAIEADPSRATSLLPPSSEYAKRSIEGLKRGTSKSVEDQLRAQLAGSAGVSDKASSPTPAAKAASPKPAEARPAPATSPGPSVQPARAPAAPASPPAAKPDSAPASGSMDLDQMLAQGLISQREYELLMARVKKAEKR